MRARLSTSSRWLKKLAAVTDRTLHYRTSLLCGLCVLCASAFNTSAQTNFAAYWNFSQILPPTQMKRHEVSLTPLFQFTSNGTNLFIGGQTNQYFTDTNNVLVVSNLLPGFRYAVTYKPVADPFYGSKNILFTNVFPSSLTNGAYVNGADPAYLAATTNSSDTSVAANSVFLQRRNDTGSNMTFVGTLELPTGTGQVGYVWTMTDQATGAGEYQAAQGGSSGSATNVYRSQVSGSGLTISTNTLTLIYTFALSASLQGWGNWTTNTFGALFDLAGAGTAAATAATNALGLSSGLAAFRSTNTFDVAGAATAATNGYPWGVLYDATGAATAATNALGLASGLAAFRSTNTFDVAGAGTTAATAATNGIGIPSGLSAFRPTNTFDVAGAATAATNGYPWGALYDSAGAALAATNGIGLASALAAFRPTNTFITPEQQLILSNNLNADKLITGTVLLARFGLTAPAALHTNILMFKPDGSYIGYDLAALLGLTGGGGGSVTSVALTVPGEFSVSGSPVTSSGTLAVTRTADANFLGFGATNVSFIKVTNTASIGGQATMSALILTNGFTNQALTASTLLQSDANKKVSSIANAVGVLTNDASGNLGYASLISVGGSPTSVWTRFDSAGNLYGTNRIKSFKFSFPRTVDGAGCTYPNTNDFTASNFMVPLFSGSAATNVNYCRFAVRVPTDIDTSADLTASLTISLSASDTGTNVYQVGMVSIANSAALAGTAANFVSLVIPGDASGASGDVESVSGVTLTSWKSNVTAGQWWLIELRRAGDNALDNSTVASYLRELEIFYQSTQ